MDRNSLIQSLGLRCRHESHKSSPKPVLKPVPTRGGDLFAMQCPVCFRANSPESIAYEIKRMGKLLVEPLTLGAFHDAVGGTRAEAAKQLALAMEMGIVEKQERKFPKKRKPKESYAKTVYVFVAEVPEKMKEAFA